MSLQRLARKLPLTLAAACAALSCLPAAAQLTPNTQLDPVVVTATGYAQPLTDSLAHSTVLTREDIERSQAVDLPALLVREAGVQLARSGGRGNATTIFLRGAPSSQVLLLIDGVPQTRQDASGAISIEHLMLDQVERVEIVRGNVSAIYGSGAIGGVIQVFTRRGEGPPTVGLTAEGGSLGYARLAANASGKSGATRYSVGVSDERTEGYSTIDPTVYPAANPDRDGYRNLSGSASISHDLAEGHTLGLALTQSDGKLEYDSAFATPDDIQTSRTRLSNVRLSSSNVFTERWKSELALGWQRDDSEAHEGGAFGYDSEYISTTKLATWNNRFDVDEHWHLNAGLEWQNQAIASNDGFGGQLDKSRDVRSAFAGAQGELGASSLQLNLRYDDIGDVGAKTTGYAGYGWQFAPAWKAIASAASAFNAPPLGYLYAPYFGNPALQPEEATSYELGLQYAANDQRVRATLFKSRVRNQFQYDLITSTFENIGKANNEGLELSYNGTFKSTELAAGLTLQDPINAVTGERLLRRSATLASLSVWQTIGAWRVGAQWAYAGSRNDSGGVTLASYSVFDLLAQWDIARGVQLFGRIENLTDEDWQTVYGYPQPARGAFIGVRWKI
ncbi:MAG: TonB-dependent receptor [Burkholderiales bacterium]